MQRIRRIVSVMMMVALLGGISVSAASTANENNPVLKITEVSESVLESNRAYDLTVTVENIGNTYGEDLSLILLPDEDSPIVMTEQIRYKTVDYLNTGAPLGLTYRIQVDSGAEPGFYNLTLEGVMSNSSGNQVEYSESFTVEVVEGNNEVDFEVVMQSDTVLGADTEGRVGFILENKGNGQGTDVNVAFGSNDGVGVYAIGDKDRYLASIGGQGHIGFEMDLLIDEDVSGYVPISFEVTYDSGLSVITDTVITYVTVQGVSDTNVIIKSVDKSVSSIVPGQKVTYTVMVENTSDVDADYVKVSVSQEAAIVPNSQSVIMIDRLGAGEADTVKFTLEATDSAETQNYPIEFTVEYGDEATSQYSGIYITNDEEDEEDDIVSQPRIVVTDFNISSDKIFVGDTFDIDFSVTNTSDLKDVRNLKVIVETASSVNSTEAFMPLNRSSSYFVGDLIMGGDSEISMPMKVFANAEAKSYSMSIGFEYEDLDGNFYTDSETISIPVYEKTELTVSDVRIGSSLDNGYTLEVDFYNTGKVDITNMMVDLESDLAATNSNYYVGDFATGRTDVYDVEIIGEVPDYLSGNIVFTYDDTFGEEETFVKEFVIGDKTSNDDSARTTGTVPSKETGTLAASGRNGGGMATLTEEQRAEMQNMTQEERMAYIESIQNGETIDGSAVQAFDSWMIYAVSGVAVVILGAVGIFIVRRRRKAD